MPSASLLPSLLFFLLFRVSLYYIGMGHLQVLPQVRWEFPFNLVPAYSADIIVRWTRTRFQYLAHTFPL